MSEQDWKDDGCPERPMIDYENLPYLPREGIQAAGNNKFATRSLFLETANPEHKADAPWCLSEHEIYAFGRWYPSAWMAYIHATDEYDALRKICGNVRQWEAVKKMTQPKDFTVILENWKLEQAYMQKSKMRDTLYRHAVSGGKGFSASARLVLQMIDGQKPMGRPKKEKPAADKETPSRVGEDHDRLVELFGKKA